MAFTKSADGIVKQAKTKGKNLGDSGPTVMGRNGGIKSSGVTSKAMKAVGRNLARVANQKSGNRGC
jgi:hypothetical protein